MSDLGKWIMIAGLALAVIGLLMQTGALGWFGRLPGDVRIERDNLRLYFPVASMIVVSVVISVLLHLARRWL
jgi:hypothetical protein